MEAAPNLENVLRRVGDQLEQLPADRKVKMIGIIFCRPQLTMTKQELLPHLKYYHLRSDKFIDFFFVGFLPPKWTEIFDNRSSMYEVEGPDDSTWLFDEQNFNKWRETIEANSDWKYSGGNDLLLVNVRPGPGYCEAQLDLRSAICITLESVKNNENIPEISMLFESIFRYAENPDPTDPVFGFSDKMGAAIGKQALKSLFVSILPKPLQTNAKAAFSYAVRNISKTA